MDNDAAADDVDDDDIYRRRVLRLSSGIDEMGSLMWDLSLSLVLAWTITFLALIKGIKSSGKVRWTFLKYVLQFQQDSCVFPLGYRMYVEHVHRQHVIKRFLSSQRMTSIYSKSRPNYDKVS